jgi:hypothetical protein
MRKHFVYRRHLSLNAWRGFAMKVPCSMFALFLFALCASAQVMPSPSARPRVTVIQKKWRIEVINPALEKDPFKPNKDRQQEEIQQRSDATENENRIEQGVPTLPPRVRAPTPETGAHRLSVAYVYEVMIRNTGEKTIRTLSWDYVFFEPGTEREVGRRRFVSRVSISPGRTRNVVFRSASPPTGTIEATKAGKKSQAQYSEQVVIRSVEYADGSVWRAASN